MFGLERESDILNVNNQEWSRWEVYGEDGKLLHVDDHPVRKAAMTGKPVKNQLAAVRNPGAKEQTWMLISAEPLLKEDGSVYRIICTYYDITERKRAEEALQDDEVRLAADLHAMTELQNVSTRLVQQESMESLLGEIVDAAIEITDADMGNIQMLNGGDELKIIVSRGFSRPFLDFFANVHENMASCGTAMAKRERVIVEDVTKSPIFVGTPSLKVVLEAGVQAVQSTPLVSRSGRLLGMFSTHYRAPHRPEERELYMLDTLARQAADLIERMRVEEELKTAKQQAELYLDLMGHDISNMHQIALGYLELAKDNIPHNKDQTVFIDKPMEVMQRSAQLIRNVRKLKKHSEGGYQFHAVDVCKVLNDLQREYHSLDGKDVVLDLNDSVNCYVWANDLLYDVFSNLVGNAIKHTGENTMVRIVLEQVNDNGSPYYRVSVEDNGPGIQDDFKDKVFTRLLKSTSEAKGMGIGLYIVKQLVESYHGRVWVEDRVPGDYTKGAKFVVILPLTTSLVWG